MSRKSRKAFFVNIDSAFSLAELLAVILIIGILSSLVAGFSISYLRKQAANSLAEDFAAWIEEVRNSAANNVRSADNEGGCGITFNSLTSATSQAVLASVQSLPSSSGKQCSKSPNLSMSQSVYDSKFSIKPSSAIVSCGTTNQICFTPRGAVNTPDSSDFEVKIFLVPSGPLRCLRIGSILGNIEIGANNSSSSISDNCPASSFARF